VRVEEFAEIKHHVQHRYPSELRFCPLCAGAMVEKMVLPERRTHRVCSRCGYIAFLSPKLVAGCLVVAQGKALLLRRGNEPQRQRWTFPGGYVDLGESPIEAAARETFEEVGMRVRVERLLGLYWSEPNPSTVVAVYLAAPGIEPPTTSDEALEVKYFEPAAIPWDEIAFPTTLKALRDWVASL